MAGDHLRIRTSVDGNAQKEVKGLRDSFDRLQKQGAKGLGIGIGAAASLKAFSLLDSAISGVIGGVTGAIQAGSDLNETLAKSSVVFGDSAGEIAKWGDGAAASMGLSKNAAISAAAGFGDLFNKIGIAADRGQDMSKSLVTLASDLASFNNLAGGSEEALEKLRSGLAGEAEPLRSMGVFLNEAKVKAKAMQLGLVGANGALTEGAKVQARYALILDETGSAQGDYARTSDGLANSQRSLSAKVDDLSAKLGQSLVPAIDKVVDAASTGVDVLGALGGVIGGVVPPFAPDDILDYQDALRKANAAAADARESHVILGGTIRDLTRDVQDVKPSIGVLTDKLGDLEEAADDAGDALVDALFGKAELKNRESTLVMELADAIKKLKELEAIKNPTRAQRRDMLETRGTVIDLRGELLETRLALFEMGDKPTRDKLTPWLEKIALRTDAAGAKARALLAAYRKLAALGALAGQGGLGNPMPRAHGGPVSGGSPYLVGERGPELFVPNQSGQIVPNGGGGGGEIVIHTHLNLDGRQIAAVVDHYQDRARAQAPRSRFAV